jgi:hypothetical protein
VILYIKGKRGDTVHKRPVIGGENVTKQGVIPRCKFAVGILTIACTSVKGQEDVNNTKGMISIRLYNARANKINT